MRGKVAVIHSDFSVAITVKKVFQNLGFEAAAINSLAKIESKSYDFILIDLDSANSEELEQLNYLKSNSSTHIVGVTSLDSTSLQYANCCHVIFHENMTEKDLEKIFTMK